MNDYNTAPHNLRRISEKDFVQGGFFRFCLEKPQFKQVHVRSETDLTTDSDYSKNTKVISMTLFYFPDNTGIAISSDYWEGKVEYYAFGCNHKYRDISQEECHKRGIYHGGSCYAVSECEECHDMKVVDSSD